MGDIGRTLMARWSAAEIGTGSSLVYARLMPALAQYAVTRLQVVSRALVITGVLLFHVLSWKLLSVPPKVPRAELPLTSTPLAILRLLPEDRPRPDLAFFKSRPPELKPFIRSMTPKDRPSQAIHLPQLEGEPPVALDSLSPISLPSSPSPTASSPPLELKLRLGRQIGGHATQFVPDPKPASDMGGISTGGISDRSMGNGRRRISIQGKCYDIYPSRASQLDPSRPGLQRDLQLVKPCD